MTTQEFAPVTPGEMLKEEFLAEYGLSQNELAKAVGISPNRITDIVNNRRRITADTALRLGDVASYKEHILRSLECAQAAVDLEPDDRLAHWALLSARLHFASANRDTMGPEATRDYALGAHTISATVTDANSRTGSTSEPVTLQ